MLQCKNIMKDYVSGDEIVHALKGVSLSFREHEICFNTWTEWMW